VILIAHVASGQEKKMTEVTKPRRTWQNLLHKKCPNCDGRLDDHGDFFYCTQPHPTEEGRNCFMIRKTKAAEYLLNPEHPANYCLSPNEKEQIAHAIQAMGIVV